MLIVGSNTSKEFLSIPFRYFDANGLPSLLQQVTADLYDIYLTVLHYHSSTEDPLVAGNFDGIQKRGDPLSPGRFLLYTDDRHYQPYVQPVEYRSPDRSTISIRRPYPNINIPMLQVQPVPIETLVLKDVDNYLSKILWVDFKAPEDVLLPFVQRQTPVCTYSPSFQTLRIEHEGVKNGHMGVKNQSSSPTTEVVSSPVVSNPATSPNTTPNTTLMSNSPPASDQFSNKDSDSAEVEMPGAIFSPPIRDIENPTTAQLAPVTVTSSAPNYARMKIADLDKLIKGRKIKLPAKIRYEDNTLERKKLYAPYLEAWDLENENNGRNLSDILDFADGPRQVVSGEITTNEFDHEERAGGVLRQITTKTVTRVITSVSADWLPAREENPEPRDGIQFNKLSEKELVQLVLGANQPVTGNRDTDIETYREWRRNVYAEREKAHDEEKSIHGDGGNTQRTGGITTVNSRTPKFPEPEHDSGGEESEGEESGGEESEGEGEEQEPEVGPSSSPELGSLASVVYSNMSAAALKREAAARDPPIKVPCKEKAAETKKILPLKLMARDAEDRERRNEFRVKDRGRAEVRKQGAEGEKRAAKRLKVSESADAEVLVGDEGDEGEVLEGDEEFAIETP